MKKRTVMLDTQKMQILRSPQRHYAAAGSVSSRFSRQSGAMTRLKRNYCTFGSS